MPTKKANGEGSIQKYYKDGVQKGWRATLTIGRDNNGKLVRKQFYGKTKVETIDKMNEYKIMYNAGQLHHENINLSEWFYTWLFEFRINDLKPSSFERYEGIYRNYVKNSIIGNIKLQDLRSSHIQSHYNILINNGKPVSTIKNINKFIYTCLGEAVKQRYILHNPCENIKLPKEKINSINNSIEILTVDQQQAFTGAITGHELEILFMFDLGTGLRLGELLALRWDDINPIDKTVTVNRSLKKVTLIDKENNRCGKVIEQTPKTQTSYRTIPIPNKIYDMLMNYKNTQNNIKSKNEPAYNDQGYIFCNSLGYPLESKRPGRNYQSVLKKLGITPLKFHSLRHTYCTRLFEAGVPIKTVQALMGHSDIATTMNIYTHVTKEKKVEAAEILNKIFE